MSNQVLVRNFKAEGAIPAFTIFKMGSADGQILAGAAATDKLMGVTTDIAAAINERCDGMLVGIADVLYGGAVARGDPLTSDALGRAVNAAPAAGSNVRVIGTALVSGVLGDIGQVNISPSVMQG